MHQYAFCAKLEKGWINLHHMASVRDVVKSFDGSSKETIALDFLEPYVRNGEVLHVNKESGVVSADMSNLDMNIVEFWSKNIFTSNSPEDYTGYLPFAQGRLFYVFRTVVDVLKLDSNENLTIADFGAGEGILLDLFKRHSDKFRLVATEHSPQLVSAMNLRSIEAFPSALHSKMGKIFNAKVGLITWTLSCCSNPFDTLLGIRDNLDDEGYLVVAESSRVLVPFRKPLSYLLNKNLPTHIHPWYFSKNSLHALLVAAGFEICFTNRFYDSDSLVVIAKKKKSLPSDNQLLLTDNPINVIDFFKKYHELQKFFMNLLEQSGGGNQ